MQIKILIAEDSAVDMMIIKKMLSEYSILTARDGVEAMQILEEHDDIDLLILDLHMPNMDGFQVLERLKSDARYQKIRTIILTVYDELANEIKGLKLGGKTFDVIFNQAPICIAICYNAQPATPETNKVCRINPMFEQITGR